MFLLVMFAICVLGVAIMFSGNRMPLITFLFGLFLIFLFKNKLKKILLASFLVLFSIFGIIFSFDAEIKKSYLSYYKTASNIIFSYQTREIKNDESKVIYQEKEDKAEDSRSVIIDKKDEKRPWTKFLIFPEWKGENLDDDFEFFWVMQKDIDQTLKIYLSAIDIWKKNKIFGNGIKSFRLDC